MQALRFDAAVEQILEREERFESGAYFLLKDALDFTLKRSKEESGEERHVSGEELIFGFRDFALQEFGPMAQTLLREWGVHTCADVGDMVFELIAEGMFGKQDSDTREDFCDHYEFDVAFLHPFLPTSELGKGEQNPSDDSDPPSDEETPFSHAPQDAS